MITQIFVKVVGTHPLNDKFPVFTEKNSDKRFTYIEKNWNIFQADHCYLIETEDVFNLSAVCDGYIPVLYKVWDYGTTRHPMHKRPKLILQQDYYNAE